MLTPITRITGHLYRSSTNSPSVQVGIICSDQSAAVSRDISTAHSTANTVAHEMGHNIGFAHFNGNVCFSIVSVAFQFHHLFWYFSMLNSFCFYSINK